MDFSEAFKGLLSGKRMRRQGWSGASHWIKLIDGRIAISISGAKMDWSVWQNDILATDWVEVKEPLTTPKT